MNEQATQTPSRENPRFGRKVFFLDPPLTLNNAIIEPLRGDEYEIYVIQDYKLVKSILMENQDAMIFINIDHSLTFKQWFNFIFSFKDHPVLSTIFVGIVSERATSSDQSLFLENLPLPCGFQILGSISNAVLLENFRKIFELNGAKGNRKYIRLDCQNSKVVSACFIRENKLYEVIIKNISSVGFACTFDEKSAKYFKENAVFNNISFTFGRNTIVCPSVVFRIMENTAVFLFTSAMPLAYKEAIRRFVQSVLIKTFELKLKNYTMDFTKYKDEINMGEVAMAKDARNSQISFDGDSDFGNLENVEEI